MTAVIMQGVSGGSDQDDSERGGEKWYLKDGTTGFSEGDEAVHVEGEEFNM